MAENIYHDNLNTESPLLDSTGTPSVEATNNDRMGNIHAIMEKYFPNISEGLNQHKAEQEAEKRDAEIAAEKAKREKAEQEQAQKMVKETTAEAENALRKQYHMPSLEESQEESKEKAKDMFKGAGTPLISATNSSKEAESAIPTVDIFKWEEKPFTDSTGMLKALGHDNFDIAYRANLGVVTRKSVYNNGANAQDWRGNLQQLGNSIGKFDTASYQRYAQIADYARSLTDMQLTNVTDEQFYGAMNGFVADMRKSIYEKQHDKTKTAYTQEEWFAKRPLSNRGDEFLNVDNILNHFARKDKGGHTYYDFNGGRIYGEQNARNAITPYVQEYNHRLRFKDDAAYREAFTQKKFGVSYEQWVKQHYDETIQPLVDELTRLSNEWGKKQYEKEANAPYIPTVGENMQPNSTDSYLAEIGVLKRKAEALRDPSFANGVAAEWFSALQTAAGDWGAVGFEVDKAIALSNAYKGRKLSDKDKISYAAARLEQAMAEFKQEFRQDFSWADFSGGVTASLGFMLGMMRDTFLFGGGAKGVAKEVVEETAKEYSWETLKQTAKGVGKGILFEAKITPFTNTMWQNFGERRNQQFYFDGNKLLKYETNPYLDLLKAYGTTAIERGTESAGELIDFGMNAGMSFFGRKLAQNKIFDYVAKSKFGRAAQWLGDFAPISATKEGLRAMRLNGLVGETAEEYLGMFLSAPIEHLGKDNYLDYIKEDYNKALSSDTFLQTLAICGGLSGFGMAVNSVGGMYNGVRISSLRNEVRKDINNISNVNLRDVLYGEMNTPRPNFNKLASLKWKGVNVADATLATRAIFNSAKVQVMRGAEMEVKRLQTFMPVIAFSVNSAYRGVNMASTAPTTDVVEVHEKDAQGNATDKVKGYAIYGDVSPNAKGIVQMRNFSGQVENISARDVVFVRKSLSDHLAEQYNLAFSDSIEKERLEEIMQNMEDRYNVDSEAREKMLQENGFSRYKVGDVVTLVSGQQATIKGNAKNGQYTAEVLSEDGKSTTMLVGFESILNEQNPTMAQAQVALFQEGKMDAPIILPTTKDGRVSLDNVSDPQVIADVLPSQVGGDAKAVEILDNEITRLKGEQAKMSQSKGLDAATENYGQDVADRINVLETAKKIIAPEVQSKEEVVEERKRNQKKLDEMSTYEFSRDYRSRNMDTQIGRNALKRFVSNIDALIAKNKAAIEAHKKGVEKAKEQLDSALNNATSDAEVAAIREQNGLAYEEVAVAERSIADIEAENKLLEHRKAQYQQTIKDMGGNIDTTYQEGTIGADKKIFEYAEKASKVLGMEVKVDENAFTSSRQNGVHRVTEDGKSVIYINPNSTEAEQGVGIMAHEIGHEFKKVLTPEEWAKFEGLVLTARFGKDWANSEAYKKEIEAIQNAEKSVNGQGISDAKAREEAVTYALQTFIFDGERGARAFEAILNQDLNWRDKLMEVFRKVVDRLKSLFNVEKPTEQDLAVQSAIEEFGNIFKRYADTEKINKVGDVEKKAIAEANATDEVSHSLALADVLEAKSEAYHQKNATNVSAKTLVQANSDIQAMVDIMRPYLDQEMYGASVLPKEVYGKGLSTIFKNQSYGASMENTTICLRTLAYIEFVDDVKEKLGRPLTTEESFLASQMLYDIATDPQCLYCDVSLDRKAYDESFLSYLKQRDDVLKMYDAIEGRKTKKAVDEVYQTFLGGRKDTPQMKARFNMWIDAHKKGLPMITASELRNTKSIEDAEQNGDANLVKQIKDAKKYAQSASWAKKIEDYRAYTGELLKISDKMYQRLNNAYGLRFYSFSEYTPAFIVENMQMMRDASLKGLRGLAYTKEVEFVKIFAPTNANINISIFGRRDADGNMIADTRQGADWNEAQALREQYPNVGLVFVATNDADVEWALAQDFIDVVIPFHIVRTGSNIADFYEWTNYKDMQEDKGGKSILPNEHNNDKETFLRLAEERGLTPRFSKWVDNPNYMKLVNETRRASKDTPFLQPIFNLDEAKASFKAFVDKGGYFGGWYNVDEQGYQDGVEQVYQDIVAGKTAKDVDYGRQDVPADALNTKRKVRQHNNVVLRSSNSLQKRPNTQEVVSEADVVESFSISRNNEATIDKWLGKREDFTDEVKNAFKEYIADFKPATQLATTKWYANGVIRIPEDMPKVEQAMAIAQKAKVDALQYNSPMEIIDQLGEQYKPKEKLINPDDVPTLTNKVQVPNTDITIYDVEDSEESRKNFRELMNSHLGKESSPWCILQADSNGVLTKESAGYWKSYSAYQRKAAFKGGKLIAFFASAAQPTWWDRMDQPHSDIPVIGKIGGDKLGRTATILYNEETGDVAGYVNIHKGNTENGVYETWWNMDTPKLKVSYKDGQRDGLGTRWHRNGQMEIQVNFANGLKDGVYKSWYSNGVLASERVYSKDLLTSAKEWDADGTLTKHTSTNDKVRFEEHWNEKGEKKFIELRNVEAKQSCEFLWNRGGNISNIRYKADGVTERWDYGYKDDGLTLSYTSEGKGVSKNYGIASQQYFLAEPKGEVTQFRQDNGTIEITWADGSRYIHFEFLGKDSTTLYLAKDGEKFEVRKMKSESGESVFVNLYTDRGSSNVATITNGELTIKGDITQSKIDGVMAEVGNRLDMVDQVAFEVQEDINKQKARAEKIREMYRADKVADIESIEDVDKMLEKINSDLASTKGSFSIDRSQSVEEIAEPRTEQSFSILREEDTDTIFATAKEEFASTNDWKKTGWLMPDGTQLDFAEGGDYRGTDHRAIGAAYKGVAEHQWQYLQDFESRGGIRIHMNRDGKYGTIEMTIKPTAEQKKKLRSFIGAVGGNVDVDFMDENYNTAHSASYEGVSPARVLSGITSFYDEGIKPKGNVSYSVSRQEAKLKDDVRVILDEYNNEGMQYRSEIDVANGVEALINDYEGDATELENILNDFRMAQDDARTWGNRMDAGGEEVFMDALNAWVNEEVESIDDTDTSKLFAAVKTLYEKGKEVASRLFSMQFFDVAKTPKFMKDLGLRGDKFTVRYGVISRHIGKDSSHFLTEDNWRELPTAIRNPFAIAKLTDVRDGYRIYTPIRNSEGEFIVVGARVKSASREIEVNAIDTAFGRRNKATLPANEEVIYKDKKITPEQSSLLNQPNSGQYPTTQELSADKDTTTNPKKQISEQESYSLNLDDVTIATPEMEAEANEELELSEEQQLMMMYAASERRYQNYRKRVAEKRRNLRLKKNEVIDEVRKFLRDKSFREGAFNLTARQYFTVVKNILNTIKRLPENKTFKIEDVHAIVMNNLLSSRIAAADGALRKVGKDFKKVITKKREGKNTRGEVRQKYVSEEVRLIVEKFTNAINTLFAEEKDGKTSYRYDDVMKAGTVLVASDGKTILDPINDAILELEERAEEGEAFAKGVTNLLETFRNVREIALRVNGIRNEASNIDSKIKPFEDKLKEIRELRKLIKSVRNSSENWQSAWRAIRSNGFATIEQAEARLAELQQEAEANEFNLNLLRGDKQMTKSIEADLMTELVEAVRNMNTAINSVDKEGRIALKEELAKKKEADIEFKRGILRSIRSPYYINAVDDNRHNTKRNKGQLTRSQRRDMLRRGDGFLDAIVDSFEYVLRKMDRMSMPNQWLQSGIYYQFIMHPTQGILARADWRYKTEKAIREMLNKKAKAMLAPKRRRKFTIEDLNKELKKESGIIINPYRSNIKGEAVSSSAVALPINLTVDQLLYIRAMVAQDGGIKGYLTLGLTVDQVDSIIKETEARYPELCAFDDWIRGEGGFLDEVYKIRNEIYRKLYGRDLPHTKGYFPIQRLAMAIHSDESVGETISINTIAGGIGSNKERVQNALPMDINVGYFEKLESHINESMQWCQEIELVEKMNVLLSSPMFRDILKEQGITKEKFKNAFLRGIGERLGEGNSKNQTFNRFISSATKHIVASNVSFNLNAALKQLVSSTAAFSQELNPKLWAHFVKNFLVPTLARSGVSAINKALEGNIDQVVSLPVAFGCWKWARENMPTFAERIDSGTLGYEIFEQDGIETWDKINNYINKVGLSANRFFDLLTCSVVGKTYYDFWKERNLERGMTEQEAHDDARMRAAILINQTQQSSLGAFLGKIQADKGDTVTALWRAVVVSYNNSNISFDRNTRAATIALNTMIHDTFVDPKVRKKIIQYKAEEYVSRGIEEEDAKALARKDYTESFFTQLNQFVHNGILNHIFWAIGGFMSTILPPIILGMTIGAYDDEDEELSYDYIKKQLIEALKGGWIYLAPGSSNILSKGWWESVAEGKFERGVAVNIQPLADTIDAWIKWLSSDEYVTDEELKQLRLQAFLTTFDMATKAGFGFSSRTLTRMYNGFKGLKEEGTELEHIYNILSTPRQTTSWFVGRPRKDEKENMKKYIERVSGMQKVVNGLGKGEDDSKIRKQYIDRMDEIMFYGTDFDYDAFKELEKWAKHKDARLPLKSDGTIREGVSAPTAEEAWRQMQMHAQKARANAFKNTLQYYNNWDEEGAKDRKKFYEKQLNALEAFKKISETPQEELIPVVSEITYQQTYDDYLDNNINKWGYKKRTESEIERRSKKTAHKIASDREKYITDYNARLNEQNK